MALMHDFFELLDIYAKHKILNSSLIDIIKGQMMSGGITLDLITADKTNHVKYDMNKNIIQISDPIFHKIYLHFKAMYPARVVAGKHHIEGLEKNPFALLLGTILYFSIYAYNKHQRGALLHNEITRQWYSEFMYRSIFEGTGKLTTISRKAASMWGSVLMKIILEYIEIPIYNNVIFTERDLKTFKGIIINQNNNIFSKLEYFDFDQVNLDAYSEWFGKFLNEYIKLFDMQHRRVGGEDKPFDHDYIFKKMRLDIFTFSSLDTAYGRNAMAPVMKLRLPSPPFRELFILSEPLAQFIYTHTINGKAKHFQDIQEICARGLSFLKPKE